MSNGLPDEHPKLLFKGDTSLSKGFGLIQRLSEDIDIVVVREHLGFEGQRDSTNPESDLSNKKRLALFRELKAACSECIRGRMRDDLTVFLGDQDADCSVEIDSDDEDQQTLLVQYPSLFSR